MAMLKNLLEYGAIRGHIEFLTAAMDKKFNFTPRY
jgi:hypothetical protein